MSQILVPPKARYPATAPLVTEQPKAPMVADPTGGCDVLVVVDVPGGGTVVREVVVLGVVVGDVVDELVVPTDVVVGEPGGAVCDVDEESGDVAGEDDEEEGLEVVVEPVDVPSGAKDVPGTTDPVPSPRIRDADVVLGLQANIKNAQAMSKYVRKCLDASEFGEFMAVKALRSGTPNRTRAQAAIPDHPTIAGP